MGTIDRTKGGGGGRGRGGGKGEGGGRGGGKKILTGSVLSLSVADRLKQLRGAGSPAGSPTPRTYRNDNVLPPISPIKPSPKLERSKASPSGTASPMASPIKKRSAQMTMLERARALRASTKQKEKKESEGNSFRLAL
eukprot:jgi/Bigna1/88973/estExt_fgenesh1_pg.C_410106